MRLFLRNWQSLAIALALAGGEAECFAQQRIAASSRHFTPHEIWGEPLLDPQAEAALAMQQLPSPEETIGVAWDEPANDDRLPELLSPELPADPRSTAVPRLSYLGEEEMSLEPVEGTNWRSRPWFAGAFFGAAFPGDLTSRVKQSDGPLAGMRLGWDLDRYYGLEARYAVSNSQIVDGAGNSLGGSQDQAADVSALYYPLGDARWRPYFGLGVGAAAYRFRDETGELIRSAAVSMPVSVGVKYFYSPYFTLRLDAVDNVTFGSDELDARNNLFLLGSVEYRFGGGR
jgi:hypothetical protein